jgi:hypothetical protein
MTYYTLFILDDTGIWHDEFGSERRTECLSEVEWGFEGTPRSHTAIINTQGTFAGLKKARDILNGVSA